MDEILETALEIANAGMAQLYDTPRFSVSPNGKGGYIIYGVDSEHPISTRFMEVDSIPEAVGALRAITPSYVLGYASAIHDKNKRGTHTWKA